MDKLIRLEKIIGNPKTGEEGILPISRTTWYRGVNEGKFPKPVHLSPGCTAWRESEVMDLLKPQT
jgi:prophage regulatory protein